MPRSLYLLPCVALLLAASPAPRPLPTPPPTIQAIDLGPAFRGTDPHVLGFDGAFSLPEGQHHALWVFGDTLLGDWLAGGKRRITGFPPNTGAIVDNADWMTGFARARYLPRPFLRVPGEAKGVRAWPLDLVHAAGKDWLFYVEIAPKGSGPLDFSIVGTDVAARDARGGFTARKRLWPGNAPSFGASALVRHGDLYLYAGGASTYVARAPLGAPDTARFEYWAGDRWSPNWHDATSVATSGPEVSVRYNHYLQSYVMIDVPVFGHTVDAAFAPTPQGPWSTPVHVADCQPAGDPDAMFYGAKQHQELETDGGREIVVSYNTNAKAKVLPDRPDLYWPRLLRVRFTRAAGLPGQSHFALK